MISSILYGVFLAPAIILGLVWLGIARLAASPEAATQANRDPAAGPSSAAA
jgi:hypothetical protein